MGKIVPKKCEHKWIHQSSHYQRESNGYNDHFKKLDIYYCEKCLEQKEVTKEEYAREAPLWYRT